MPNETGSGRNAPGQAAPNPFIARLRRFTGLSQAELSAVERLCGPPRQVAPKREIALPGRTGSGLNILVEGWAARVKVFQDGRRQFTALLLPGDVCDIDALHLHALDFSVVALERCTVVPIPRDELLEVAAARPAVGRMLTWLASVENVIMSEWITWQGRRSAGERLANLFCELHARLEVIGRAEPDGFALPLTQEDLADAAGLTSIHVNRTLRDLREQGLAELRGRRVVIPDLEALKRAGGFSPRYLRMKARLA